MGRALYEHRTGLALALALALAACGTDTSTPGQVTGDTYSPADTTGADTVTDDGAAPEDTFEPPPPDPAYLEWHLTPARAVYRPNQTVSVEITVLADDGAALTEYPLTFISDGADDVAFDAEARSLKFLAEGEITLSLCVGPSEAELCSSQDVWVDAGAPSLVVTAPLPGAEIGGDGGGTIVVEGTVDDAQPVTVLVNQQVAARDGDAFFAELDASFGVHHLVVSAVDQLGHETSTELDVLWAPAYSAIDPGDGGGPLMTAATGMALRLTQGFFDDGVPVDLTVAPPVARDLAGILELVIPNLNLSSYLPDELGGGTGLSLEGAHILGSSVVVDVTDDGLELYVTLDPVRVSTAGSFTVGDTHLGLGGHVDVAFAAFAVITADKPGADDPVDVEMTDLVVVVEGLDTAFDDPAANALFTLASSQIRMALEDAAHDALDDALTDTLPAVIAEAFQSIDQALRDVSVPLTEPFEGVTVHLDGRLAALRTRYRDALTGSLTITSGVGDQTLTSSRGLAMALSEEASGAISAGRCGDGQLDPGEACDDGGRVPGDGCDQGCRAEGGWLCQADGCTRVCTSGDGVVADDLAYRYCTSRVTRDTAAAYCAQLGGTLAIAADADAHDVIAGLGSQSSHRWLGATTDEQGDWRWDDGTLFWQGGLAVGEAFTAWASGAPSAEGGCATVRNGEWFALDCAEEQRFICQLPARCGDGVVGPGETCDDGDLDDVDGCTRSCAPSLFGGAAVEVAVPLSFVNGLLHQLWSAGLLEIDATSFLGDRAALVEQAATHGRLPPVVRAAYAWEPSDLVLSIGQLELELSIASLTTTFAVRLDAGLTVTMVDNGVVVDIAEEPLIRTWVAASDTDPPLLTPEVLADLLREQVWPDMRDALQSVLSLQLPLPSIDLGAVAPSLGVLEMNLVPDVPPAVQPDLLRLRGALEAELHLIQ